MAIKIQLTREQALAKAILSKLHDRNEFRDLLDGVTGEILGAAEELRGDDVLFNFALHPDVYNEISDAVTKAVELVVENWDIEL